MGLGRAEARVTLCYDLADPGARPEAVIADHVPIVQRPRTWPFQGQNTGSNPVGDATHAERLLPAVSQACRSGVSVIGLAC
jgi:hypothetical protein